MNIERRKNWILLQHYGRFEYCYNILIAESWALQSDIVSISYTIASTNAVLHIAFFSSDNKIHNKTRTAPGIVRKILDIRFR